MTIFQVYFKEDTNCPMWKLFNPLTPLVIVGLVLAACGNNTPATLPPPQPTATPAGNSGLGAPAGPPDPAAPLQETTLGDPTALAYNPADGNLLKADNQGHKCKLKDLAAVPIH